MEYHEAVDFLFDLRRFKMRPGIESAAALRAELGDPGTDIRFVQVAGSNGKGSTAKLTESVLREAGLSVGLYTSPHLETLNERIQVDGRPITDQAITEFVERVKPWLIDRAAGGEPLTFFEVVTLLGLWYFDRQNVDVAVLEIGLGGEYDATSVVDPVASCVTNISLEHTSVLGDTVKEIATTKAAVAPDDAPLVTGATGEALSTLKTEAGAVLTVGTDDDGGHDDSANGDDMGDGDGDTADRDDTAARETAVTVSYDGRVTRTAAEIGVSIPSAGESQATLPSTFADGLALDARLPLLGEHQAINAGIATTLAGQVVDSLNGDDEGESAVTLDDDTLRCGLRNAHWPGRFEVIEQAPLTVFDGAHNPDAIERVAETLSTFEYDELHVVFGAMHDKSYREMVAALPRPDSVVTCRPNLDRAEDPAVLARCFDDLAVDAVTAGDAVADALATARERVGPDDCLLVTGSLFAVGEARATVTRLETPKRVPDTETAVDVLANAHATADEIDAHHERAVHRTVSTRVDDRQAAVLGEVFPAVGGTCVASGVTDSGERHAVVLAGTLAEFRALTQRLADHEFGLPGLAADLRAQLGLDDTGGEDGSGAGAEDGSDDATTQSGADYPWTDGTAVMGILNVTPDSFYDGGEFFDDEAAIEQAETLRDAGADIIDVGGESTRPGAEPVPVADEIDRVVPVIDAIADLDVWLSVDTRKPAVAEAALDAGADIINDVTGLDDSAMRELAADREVPVIVMHSIDAPVVPDKTVDYDDVVADVIDVLNERLLLAEKAGIPRERIIVDPGIGFGKTSTESFELLDRLGEFDALGCPLLVGHSRKSMFSDIDSEPDDRLDATIAATALAAERGADIVRVHDVDANRSAVDVVAALDEPDSVGE